VFVANDQMALGLLRQLREAGRNVPRDLSVVGFDDMPEAAYFTPPLTTIRQDFTELGRRCLQILLSRIEGEQVPQRVVVEPMLVVRESTARAS
jgi:DNA-binding LacI/PurR family transcriptional regulator